MGQFRDRMDEELRIRGYSASTRECYVRCVRNFVRHFMRPPDQLTLEHIRQYQLHLTRDRHVAWSYFYNSCRNRHAPSARGWTKRAGSRPSRAICSPCSISTSSSPCPPSCTPSSSPRRRWRTSCRSRPRPRRSRTWPVDGWARRSVFTAVLHTWTQSAAVPSAHPLHRPRRGTRPRGPRWVPARRDFFLPVRVLSQVFRGKLLSLFEQALDHGKLRGGRDEDPRQQLKQAARKKWVVYSKPPFAGAEQVLAYLGRYAYRIGLSNDRLVDVQDGQVTFRWKDRAHGNAPRLATLDAPTFLRRFLLHVLPHRFVRIRDYGSSPTRCAPRNSSWSGSGSPRRSPAGGATPSPAPRQPERWDVLLLRLTRKDVTQCPRCGVGHLLVVETLPAVAGPGGPSRRARSP